MIGTMVASIHSIPDTVPAAGIRNISTLTGMKNSAGGTAHSRAFDDINQVMAMVRSRAAQENPEVARRMQLDLEDAKALMVTKTPEFFVNGRALPEFGEAPLRAVVAEELKRAYP